MEELVSCNSFKEHVPYLTTIYLVSIASGGYLARPEINDVPSKLDEGLAFSLSNRAP